VTPEEFRPCLSVEAHDFEASLAHVEATGGTINSRSERSDTPGFQWARCTDAFGVPLMIFQSA
jgi:hypothetical protein